MEKEFQKGLAIFSRSRERFLCVTKRQDFPQFRPPYLESVDALMEVEHDVRSIGDSDALFNLVQPLGNVGVDFVEKILQREKKQSVGDSQGGDKSLRVQDAGQERKALESRAYVTSPLSRAAKAKINQGVAVSDRAFVC